MDLTSYLKDYGIELSGALPLSCCHLRKPYLLKREGLDLSDPSALFVCLFAVPYLTREADRSDRNLSAYAVPRDYHLFFSQLYEELLPRLRKDFRGHRFAAFVDHSPIDEISAAVDAGLGVRGKNHLLLTNRYSSYVFLGEIITTLPLRPTPTPLSPDQRVCHDCGACQNACPMTKGGGICRSALTQKKGTLSEEEYAFLSRFPSVWGCDVCQEVCPYTTSARMRGTIYTDIPFFKEQPIAHLTLSALDSMSDDTFAARAYAWRGRDTIRRNLLMRQAFDKKEEDPIC